MEVPVEVPVVKEKIVYKDKIIEVPKEVIVYKEDTKRVIKLG